MRTLPRVRAPGLRPAGFTLIEMMVSMAILSIIALVVSTFIVDSHRVNVSIEAQTESSIMGQQVLDDVRWRLEQSRRLVDRGEGILEVIDLSTAPPAAGETRLPKIEPNGSLSPYPGRRDGEYHIGSVGNALLFVEAEPPFREAKSGRLVDLYHFVLYYVAKRDGKGATIGPMDYWLDLVRFESQTYADFQQVDGLPEELQRDVVAGLAAKGVTLAWDANARPDGAFSRLAGGRVVHPPDPIHKIPPKKIEGAIPGLGHGERVSGRMSFTIAPNRGPLPIKQPVPEFAEASEGFPFGFEVLIAGPGHGRKVMVRIVIAAHAHQRYFSREHQMIAAVWD